MLYGAVSQRYSSNAIGIDVYDLARLPDAAFSVHHGEQDHTVNPNNSRILCEDLEEEAGRDYECYFYEDQPHTFISSGEADPLFIQRTVDFYDTYLVGE